MSKIIIGSDHGGFSRKEEVKKILRDMNIDIEDAGTFDGDISVDYPDIAEKVGEEIRKGNFTGGILLCGTGIGISIAANKIPSIRAALCYGIEAAKLSKAHNNANILVLPGRLELTDKLEDVIKTWIKTPFDEGRHIKRLEKIEKLEKKIY